MDWIQHWVQFAFVAVVLVLAVLLGDAEKLWRLLRPPVVRLVLGFTSLMIMMYWGFWRYEVGYLFVGWMVFAAMLLIGSIPLRYVVSFVLVVLMAIPLYYFFPQKPYAKASRIDTYLEMLINGDMKPKDIQGSGWTPHHVQLGTGSAGYEGKGPFSEKVEDQASIHRTFLPQKDVASSLLGTVIAEEFGFRGNMILITVYLALLWSCFQVALSARDALGRVLALGVMATVAAHVLMHVGSAALLTPITNLPLPLMSYGGSSIVLILFLLGLVQSVWVHRLPGSVALPDTQPREAALEGAQA